MKRRWRKTYHRRMQVVAITSNGIYFKIRSTTREVGEWTFYLLLNGAAGCSCPAGRSGKNREKYCKHLKERAIPYWKRHRKSILAAMNEAARSNLFD